MALPSTPYATYFFDQGKYDATVAGSLVTTDNGAVKRWEDQSGNGRHLTQGTAAKFPLFDANRGVVTFQTGNTVNNYLAMPASFGSDRQTWSEFFILRFATLRDTFEFQTPSRGTSDAFQLFFDDYGTFALHVLGGAVRDSVLIPRDLCLIGITSGTGGAKIWINGVSTSVSALTAGAFTKAFLGGDLVAGNWRFGGDMKDVLFYDRELTDLEVADIWTYAQTRGVNTTYDMVVNFDGDSITQGETTTLNRGYVNQISRATAIKIGNGKTNDVLADMITRAATVVDVIKIGGKLNVASIFAGTNDIALNSRTGLQVYTDTITYVGDRRTAGWDNVIVGGMLPRSGTDTQRAILRSDCLAHFSTSTAVTNVYTDGSGNYYIDFEADAGITLTDGIHPDNAGSLVIAGYYEDVLELISPTVDPALPEVPANLAVVASGAAINGTFDRSTDHADFSDLIYEIYRSTDNVTYTLLTSFADRVSPSFSDSTVSANTAYYYKVAAVSNEFGSSALSSEQHTTSNNVPGAPVLDAITGLEAGSTGILVEPTAPASDGGSAVLAYEIWHNIESAGFVKIGTLLAANLASHFLDRYVITGLSVDIKVRCRNAVGNSAYSATRTIVSQGPDVLPSVGTGNFTMCGGFSMGM